ncbi:MAG: AzlD domain-containing protein [Oscillospiraceae bacterium]|nr:AzlD domain-containing protein [Oscillospiraceae bacterium]MBP1555289.1 AzlD domain-containing protein [Oscillospiraceae bacterium]MBQ5340567.1 AzlD domain-containing protein [Oscillospiraceae bacterium]MBQ5342038.1 AzlD domain-containing protein [Oscillospiraceae bacterium]
MKNNYIYIAVMAGVSFLIRVLPLTVIRKQIKSRFLRSFLFYVPYVTLAVMTFPAIITASAHPVSGAVALVAGIILAWLGGGLFPVAILCSVTVFVFDALL